MFYFRSLCLVLVFSSIERLNCQLLIQPAESVISRNQHRPLIALCTGQSQSPVTWRSPSQIDIAENSNARVTVERRVNGLRLRIRNLTQSDQGLWTCLGVDSSGKSLSKSLQILVKAPIIFVADPIQYVKLNSLSLIKCRVTGSPSAEISWFKGREKQPIVSSSNYEQKIDGLKISRVSAIDADLFWCQADVMETGESQEFLIEVHLAQEIQSVRITCLSPCAVEKRTATLICEADGMPTVEYSWFYAQNLPIVSSGSSKFLVRGNRLLINYVDQTDQGRYVCHAVNDYDRQGQRADYDLRVLVPPELHPIAPMEIRLDENNPFQQATFTCRLARGSTDGLTLEWILPNHPFLQSMNISQILMGDHSSQLQLNPVRREHHGNYTCRAKNLADFTSTVTQLTVQYPPVFLGPNTSFVYSVPNYRVIVKCLFDSSPLVSIEWFKDAEGRVLIDESDSQVIDLHTRSISSTITESQLTYNPSASDFGRSLECQSSRARHRVELRRAELPEIVKRIEMKPTLDSIELNFPLPTSTGDLLPMRYIVKYEQIDQPDSLQTSTFPVVSNGSQSVVLSSLKAGTRYRIQIASESHAGQSSFSIPVQATTDVGQVPRFHFSPANVSCDEEKSCSIRWIVDSDEGSPISQTQISFVTNRQAQTATKWTKPMDIGGETREYRVKDLQKNTKYLLSVRLFNAAGSNEQRIAMNTPKSWSSRDGNLRSRSNPDIFVIVLINVGIIFVLAAFLVACCLIQICKPHRGHQPVPTESTDP